MPPIKDSIISYKEWEEKYIPIGDIHDSVEDAADTAGGSNESINYIWTVVDNNPNSVYADVLPGIRLFNRLGFYVTSNPWTDIDVMVSNDPSYK